MKTGQIGFAAFVMTASLTLSTVVRAQEETLVGKGYERGGYGAPILKLGTIKGEAALFVGGRAAWILNPIAIGGGVYGLATYVKVAQATDANAPLYLDFAYGGFEVEYIHNTQRLVHWTVHVMIGGGTVDVVEYDPDRTLSTADVFMIEPSVELDLNVSTKFRIGFGLSYRRLFRLDLEAVTDGDLSGPSTLIIAKFGRF